jgi:hypothetical protein
MEAKAGGAGAGAAVPATVVPDSRPSSRRSARCRLVNKTPPRVVGTSDATNALSRYTLLVPLGYQMTPLHSDGTSLWSCVFGQAPIAGHASFRRGFTFWRTKLPAVTARGPLLLSDLDKLRLERYAPWFGLTLRKGQGTASVLEWTEGTNVRLITLSAENAHLRLLAELCERVLPWVMFTAGDSCADVYLGHGESRIRRLAELFSQATHQVR